MKRGLSLLLCILLLTAAGCSGGSGNQTGGYAVYYATRDPCSDGKAVDCETHVLSGTKKPEEELVGLLLTSPASDKLVSPIPSGVTLNSWSLKDGVLSLRFSEGYGGLSGIDLTIADYCITLTLCQLDGVNSVVISADGGLVPSRYYQELRTSDVLLSETEDDSTFEGVTLYFPKADGTHLAVEHRDVINGEGLTRSEAVVTALIKGPEGEGMLSLMPKDAHLISVTTENGICYVNFSRTLASAPVAGTSEGALLLYSVVDTLCSLGGVDQVQLLIEGEAPSSFGGVPTLTPLEADYSLVEKD